MRKQEPLFNSRILRNIVNAELTAGLVLPVSAAQRIAHWAAQLQRGAVDRMSESSAEQTFNNEIFGTVLGYEQFGAAVEASLLPKRTGPSGRDTPDFVLGRFDLTAGVEEWVAVGEIKNSKTDLDHPQVSRPNRETPVEQAFRYANRGRPGVEWIVITNFREIRLYKNGYVGAYHCWRLEELTDAAKLAEFYVLLRPDGLINRGREPTTARVFRETISAGRDLTEGFYGLYKGVQGELVDALEEQPASHGMSTAELQGKIHKLLNRVLFIAFCEKHPAELVPSGTLRQVLHRARVDGSPGAYWREYKQLFHVLNVGGGLGGFALNAFNGGLFARDAYFEAIDIPNELFTRRFRVGKGRRKSLEITGILGFDVYDFAEDLNVQALGAIFEQSLKDIPQGEALVRGVGESTVSSQESGGVFYTPREITGHLVRAALTPFLQQFEVEARRASASYTPLRNQSARAVERARKLASFEAYANSLRELQMMDPACGSGAFLVEALEQLMFEYDKVNRAMSEVTGDRHQLSILDLDRLILRENLHGRDILPESVEISRLSIWLRTAKRGEPLESLSQTITTGDTLRTHDDAAYHIVVGNPPWGADLQDWTSSELMERFPDAGAEQDSYALFVIRAWEMLRPGGVLAFIVPNSWLTVSGYTRFRAWMLERFEILEVTSVWKIFADVNHDASILVARKRVQAVDYRLGGAAAADALFKVQAIARGQSETEKLRQLAQGLWTISHATTHRFQFDQPEHRFEVIYTPDVAQELDRIAARCRRLDTVADVTVGIQVYHHTRVPKEFIRARGFHSTVRQGPDWHPYIDANDVQRYYAKSSTTQWLHFNERLRDKRDLAHYAEPRILVQQIFWQRMAGFLRVPDGPEMYLNTLFSIYNPRGVPLECLLGLVNSRFVSGSYERRANRLFGDKFPKVSKADLASVPVPAMSVATMASIGESALALQEHWQALRDAFRGASDDLAVLSPGASLSRVGDFWSLSETEFRQRIHQVLAINDPTNVRDIYRRVKTAADTHWPAIQEGEGELERLVRRAYRVREDIYEQIVGATPAPAIDWALRS